MVPTSTLLPVIGLLFAAAITPGPNNFIVLEAGARRGLLAAVPPIIGVVAGSLVVLTMVSLGMGAAVEAWPQFQMGLGLAGGLYLGWLGATMLLRSAARDNASSVFLKRPSMPSSPLSVALFQLVNPKAWVLVTTTAAVMTDNVFVLGFLIALVSSICLAIWAAAGGALSRTLERPQQRLWFDRAMGAVLMLSAVGLTAEVFNA